MRLLESPCVYLKTLVYAITNNGDDDDDDDDGKRKNQRKAVFMLIY